MSAVAASPSVDQRATGTSMRRSSASSPTSSRRRRRCSMPAASTNGSRCSPTTAATGCRCRAPRRPIRSAHNSLAYEDRLLLALRVERLKNPRAHSQHPRSRCQHVLQRSMLVDAADRDSGVHQLRTPFLYVESRDGEQVLLAGAYRHSARPHRRRLAASALKRVDLLRSRAAAAGDPAVHLSDPVPPLELPSTGDPRCPLSRRRQRARVSPTQSAPAALPAMMEDAAASLGWGRWRIDLARADDAAAPSTQPRRSRTVRSLPLRRPPARRTLCHAIAGMLEAMAARALVSVRPTRARRRCRAASDGDANLPLRRDAAARRDAASSFLRRPFDPAGPIGLLIPPGDPDMKILDSTLRTSPRPPSAGVRPARQRRGGRPEGRPERVAVRARTRRSAFPTRRACRPRIAYKPEINGRKVQLDRARRRLRSDHRRPQRAQAGRGGEGRRADGHLGRAGGDRHRAGRPRDQDADDRA